ncbi:MAG: hypothetical protein ACI8ZN_002800 [Bacteroidia bacterium]|jgi:uncharacterized protein (TIRG00374 family)
MNQQGKTYLKNGIIFLFVLGLLAYVYVKIDLTTLVSNLEEANYFWVGIAFIVGILSHLIRAIRWKMLIKPLGYEVSTKNSFYSVMTGYLINMATPRMGEIGRCAMLYKTDGVPVEKLVGTVVIERLFDLIIMLLITAAVIFLQFDLIGDFITANLSSDQDSSSYLVKTIMVVLVLAFGIGAYIFYQKLKPRMKAHPKLSKVVHFIDGGIDGVKSIFKLKNPLLFIAYSLLIWVMYFLMTYTIFFAIDGTSHLGIDAALTTLIMGTLAMIIPVPGGVGAFEYLVPKGLVLYGINESVGTAYALVSHGTQLVMIIIVGGVSMILAGMISKKGKAKAAANVESEANNSAEL